MERAQYNRHSRARMAETAKEASRHATPDALERIDPRRRCTRHDHRTCCRGSCGSASLPCPSCENASKCATPDRAERVPTIGIDLIPYVDAHGRPPDQSDELSLHRAQISKDLCAMQAKDFAPLMSFRRSSHSPRNKGG